MTAFTCQWLLLACFVPALSPTSNASCAICHTSVVNDFKSHPHHAKGMGCDSCHGASVRHQQSSWLAPDRAPEHEEIPVLCGRCHPAELKSYRTSQHAKLVLEKSELKGPDCTTCHGTHKRTSAAEMENRCLGCHSASFMAPAVPGRVSCMHCHSPHSSE
jgi:hypothetical protein